MSTDWKEMYSQELVRNNELAVENTKLRTKLIKLGDTIKSIPNDQELGDEIRHKWIFESPDGGKTIYRRALGCDERELVIGPNDNPNQTNLFDKL